MICCRQSFLDSRAMANSSDLPLLAPASMRQRATDALRTAIVSGRLLPGDRLKEAEPLNSWASVARRCARR